MPLQSLTFSPGINREGTEYSAQGTYYDGDMIRFRGQFPETIGGWQKVGANSFLGTCRLLYPWRSLEGDNYLALGTNLKFYIEFGTSFDDITPIRATSTLGTDPFETSSAGSGIVTVTDVGHGASINDYVTISGATAFDGIGTTEINAEHQVIDVLDSDTYTIDTGGVASAGSVSGGGSSAEAAYQITVGLNTAVIGSGWGAGTYSRGPYGSAANSTVAGSQLRVWTADNFGEDLIFNPRGGAVYYWDESLGTSTRAVDIADVSGASDAPVVANSVMVSDTDRHVICFGCNSVGETTLDPLEIRWSNQESFTNWTPTAENTAGSLRLGRGSEILQALQTRREILVWTDESLHSMQFLGPPYTFGIQLVGANTSLIGPKAAVTLNDSAFWMGNGVFYMYNGSVQTIPCTVKDYVFSNINWDQRYKVYAGTNQAFNEIIWFYPSASSEEVDRYVIYNYLSNIWYYGTLVRTAWVDAINSTYPRATCTNGCLFEQENGLNDGSMNPPQAIAAYIETAPIDISDGEFFSFVRKVIPDFDFTGSDLSENPELTIKIKPKRDPGSSFATSDDKDVTILTVSPNTYTNQLFVRVRGRQIAMRVESNCTGIRWRSGVHRIDIRPDGRR